MPKPKNYASLPRKKKGTISKDKRLVRLLKIILAFNAQKIVNIRQLEMETGVTKRSILRDIAVLQKAGFSLYKTNQQSTFYHLMENENTLAKLEKLDRNHQFIAQYVLQLQAVGLESPIDLPLLLQDQVDKLNQQEYEESLHTKALPRSKFLGLLNTSPLCVSASTQRAVLNHLFSQYIHQQYYQAALQIANYLLKIDPSERTLLSIALCYKELKQYDAALKYCKKALHAKNSSILPLLQIVHIYQKQGQFKTALSYLEKALAKQPTYWPLIERKVNLLLQQNKPQEALSFLKKQPKQTAGKFFRVRLLEHIYEILGKWKEALKCIQELENYTTKDKPIYEHYQKFVRAKKQFLLQQINQNKCH